MEETNPAPRPAPLPVTWPYWVGGICLALINTLILLADGRPWGITSPLTHVGSKALQLIGLQPGQWTYFNQVGRDTLLSQFGALDPGLWLNLGVVAGALLASLATGEFVIRRPKKTLLALLGGLLMGYGARLALGCTIGAMIGGIASFSLHGWIFAAAVFAGVLAGIGLFRRVL